MRQVTVREAKTHLSRLIRDVLAGEEIVIARGDRPLVKLVPLAQAPAARRLGGAAGRIRVADDFDAPLEDFAGYER